MKIIDARGEICPVPVVRMKKALREAGAENIREIVDSEISKENLEKMLTEMGIEYTSYEEKGDFVVQVNRPGPGDGPPAAVCDADTVLVLSSDTMGRGDDTIGAMLMKNFLYALTESDDLPGKILLYNTGVRLATLNEDAAADLKKLEEMGVAVMVCGLCLDYFSLTEKLKAGSLTNMYAIVAAKMAARKIIQV
jgi:selenium metabolism protein YedF